MEELNSNPKETASVPVSDLAGSVSGTDTPKASPSTGGLGAGAPVASVPEAVAAPVVTVTPTVAPVPVSNLASSVPGTGTPKASPSTGGLGAGASVPASVPAVLAASAPAAAVKMELPKTTGKTPGGWNRFAGYNPNDAKNKKNDRRGDSSKGRR